ncbi:MAG: RluA family pseudouridine synthase [Sandaracinaceae bacterium]|nr:RluA family pseudouridine synthase [Sandaracinaceae bacterium]
MAIELEVREDERGLRLDVFLVRRVPGLGRAGARAAVARGAVQADGRCVRAAGQPVGAARRVTLAEAPEPAAAALAEDGPLVVLYEDPWLVVVDKPAGVPTHPLAAGERGTLANVLLGRYPEMADVGYRAREPGLLHRLDNDTSGVLLAARDPDTFEALRGALREGAIDKRYVVLVEGTFAPRTVIAAPIGPHPRDRRRVVAHLGQAPARARAARTEIVSVAPVGASLSRVEVRVCAAVRHQIRAHFAALGHPLVGDATYGGAHPELGRHFLHAASLALAHPRTGAWLEVASPLPPELEGFLATHDDGA